MFFEAILKDMLLVVILGLTVIVVVLLVSRLIWNKVKFSWLDTLCTYLVLSLPFEFFPRIDIAGSGFRISQLLVLVGCWFVTILAFKKDSRLLNSKLNNWTIFPFAFVLSSIPSWFLVQDWQRFAVHWLGSILVFGAMMLLANFATDIWSKLKKLSLVLVGCSIFGLYQFVGDLVGLPTGLREHYTKAVFGIPRVQGTAVEPLYFAGMLIVGFFILLVCLLAKEKLPQPKFLKLQSNWYILILLSIVSFAFVLTISKGSFAVLFLFLPIALVCGYFKFSFWNSLVKKYFLPVLLFIVLLFVSAFTFTDPIASLGSIGSNMIETLAGTSPSAVERNMYSSEAIAALPSNMITGIGMGQYASFVGDNLSNLNTDRKAIVNNIYLELWLENGLVAMCLFIFFLILVVVLVFRKINWKSRNDSKNDLYNTTDPVNSNELAAFAIFFSLLCYFVQWSLFSPLFIMPIFILLGLALSLIG
jgi:O-antigen ligase